MSKTRLGLYSVLWAAACASEPLSVGQPPCEADEPRCETPEQVLLGPQQYVMQEEVSAQSHVEWQRLLMPPACMPENCLIERSKFVVHDTGEITLAALLTEFEPDAMVGRTRLWVAWLDADGQSLWEDDALSPFPERRYEMPSECPLPLQPPCVGPRTPEVRSFELRVIPDGRVIALVGSGVYPAQGGPQGRLTGYAIERAGRVTPEIMVDSLAVPPGASALVEDDVIITDDWSPPVFKRYSARGELVWQRSDAVAPPPDEFGIAPRDPTATGVLQIAADSVGRLWALLDQDGMFGFVRLEPNGRPAWRAWSFMTIDSGGAHPFGLGGTSEWVFDHQQRPLIAASGLGLLRLEPEAEGLAPETPRLSFSNQEEFYSPSDVFGLDTDAEDRVYLATHEGPRSARRLRIDRLSSDLLTRERYILDLEDLDLRLDTLSGLQVAPGGDVYVLVAMRFPWEDIMGALASMTGHEAQRIQLARIQLSAPGATTAGAGAR